MFCLHFLQMKLQINLIWSNKVKTKPKIKQTPIKSKTQKTPNINGDEYIDQSQLTWHWFLWAFVMEEFALNSVQLAWVRSTPSSNSWKHIVDPCNQICNEFAELSTNYKYVPA